MKLAIAVCLAATAALTSHAGAQPRVRELEASTRKEAVTVGRDLARNPSQTAALQQLTGSAQGGNIMEVLYAVFRESIRETREDKKYYLSKLKQHNQIAEALSDYMKDLVDASRSLGGAEAGAQTARLEASRARVEAAIARAQVPDATRAEVEGLRASLERDRQLLALAQQQLATPLSPSGARPADTLVVQPALRPGVRVFSSPVFANPMNGDRRLDLCRVWGAECGQPAADAFCQQRGYARAAAWQPANDIGASTPTRVLVGGQECAEPGCDGFASITCQ